MEGKGRTCYGCGAGTGDGDGGYGACSWRCEGFPDIRWTWCAPVSISNVRVALFSSTNLSTVFVGDINVV